MSALRTVDLGGSLSELSKRRRLQVLEEAIVAHEAGRRRKLEGTLLLAQRFDFSLALGEAQQQALQPLGL